jgi:hypothetical protein
MWIEIADGPHAGQRYDVGIHCCNEGLERTVHPEQNAFLATQLGEAPDNTAFHYIAVYDSDPAFEPEQGKAQSQRSYRFRSLRVLDRQPTRRARGEAVLAGASAAVTTDMTPLTLF